MPELPEVETVVRYINPNIVGKIIESVKPQNNYAKVLATHGPKQFNELVENKSKFFLAISNILYVINNI